MAWMSKIITIMIITTILLGCSSSKERKNRIKKADLYYSEGTKQLGQKKYRMALDKLRTAAHIAPKNADIHNNLGMAYYFLKQHSEAIKHLKTAYKIEPSYTKALSNLAAVYQTQKKHREAIILHKKCLNDLVYQERYRTYYNLALIYFETNEPLEAIKNLSLSLKENIYYCPANFKMGEWEEKKRNYEQAYKHYLKASNGVCYQNPTPIYRQGLMLQKLRRYDDAITKFNNVIGRFQGSQMATLASIKKREILSTTTRRPDTYEISHDSREQRVNYNEKSLNQSPIF